MKHLKKYEQNIDKFIPGEYAYSTAFKKSYKIIDVDEDEHTIWIEDENGNVTDFLIKDFIPDIDIQINKFNL